MHMMDVPAALATLCSSRKCVQIAACSCYLSLRLPFSQQDMKDSFTILGQQGTKGQPAIIFAGETLIQALSTTAHSSTDKQTHRPKQTA